MDVTSGQGSRSMLTDLAGAFAEHSPRRVARLLEEAGAADMARVLESLAPEIAAHVVSAMSRGAAAVALARVGPVSAAGLCARLQPALVANLLRQWPDAARAELLAGLDERTRGAVMRALAYQPTQAGAHTDPHVLEVDLDTPSGAALARVRERTDRADEDVLVTDADHRFVGRVDLRELLRADAQAPIGALRLRRGGAIAAATHLADLFQHPEWSRARTLPVTDAEGRLLGVLHREALHAPSAPGLDDASESGAMRTARELAGLYSVAAAAVWHIVGAVGRTPRDPQ
jgi:magnesium transporter